MEQFPWPIQLGLVGIFAVAWITTIALHNRSLTNGKLVAAEVVDRIEKAAEKKYDDMVTLKNAEIEKLDGARVEWRNAHGVSEEARGEERTTTALAVEGLRKVDSVLDHLSEAPVVVDNGTQKGAKR